MRETESYWYFKYRFNSNINSHWCLFLLWRFDNSDINTLVIVTLKGTDLRKLDIYLYKSECMAQFTIGQRYEKRPNRFLLIEKKDTGKIGHNFSLCCFYIFLSAYYEKSKITKILYFKENSKWESPY